MTIQIKTSLSSYCDYLNRLNINLLNSLSNDKEQVIIPTYEEYTDTLKILKLQWDMVNPKLPKQKMYSKLLYTMIISILRNKKSRFKNLPKTQLSIIASTFIKT